MPNRGMNQNRMPRQQDAMGRMKPQMGPTNPSTDVSQFRMNKPMTGVPKFNPAGKPGMPQGTLPNMGRPPVNFTKPPMGMFNSPPMMGGQPPQNPRPQ